MNRMVASDIEIAASEERGGDDLSIIPPTGPTIVNVISGVELGENGPVQTLAVLNCRPVLVGPVRRLVSALIGWPLWDIRVDLGRPSLLEVACKSCLRCGTQLQLQFDEPPKGARKRSGSSRESRLIVS